MGLNNNVMKGQALIIAAIFIVIILIVLWSVVNIPALKSNQIEKDIEVRSEIHTMGNALDAAKLYMQTSLEYSIYQACYDNLKKGGWNSPASKYQGYALWDSSFQPEGFKFNSNLEESIASNLALYRGTQAYTFLSDYHVNLPNYPSDNVHVSLEPGDPGWMFVTAYGDSNLNIQKTQESGEYIRLEKDSSLQNEDEYRLDCYGIYMEGAKIHSLAKAAVQKAWADIKAPAEITASSRDDLDKKLSGYNTTFVDNAKAAVYALSVTEKDYDVSVDVLSVNLKWSKSSETVTPQGTTAELAYTPEVYVKFDITNIKDSQQFPIYDGSKVVMSPMTLVFVGKYGA